MVSVGIRRAGCQYSAHGSSSGEKAAKEIIERQDADDTADMILFAPRPRHFAPHVFQAE